MSRSKIVFTVILVFFSINLSAEDKKKNDEPKQLSGISIIGNKEAPKSL